MIALAVMLLLTAASPGPRTTVSVAAAQDLIRLTVDNRSSGPVYIRLEGEAYYYLSVGSEKEAVYTIKPGEYTQTMTACGDAINWAVIMGDTKTGLSIFWPDGGIDTGPVLLQKEVMIGEEDTTGSLYFNHLVPMGISALMESVELVKGERAPRLPQDETQATYEPICDDKHSAIDWEKPGREVYNLVRGCDPQPGAYTLYNGQRIHFYNPKFKPAQHSDSPGTILRCDERSMAIAIVDGVMEIAKVRPAGGTKTAAQEFFTNAGLTDRRDRV